MQMLYNLVVRLNESLPIDLCRMLENTDEDIKLQHMPGGSPDFHLLSQYPTILTKEFREDDETARAVIGYMDVPSSNPQIAKPILEFPSKALLDQGLLGRRGNTRTRWMVLKGDPYRLFSSISTRPYSDIDNRSVVDNHLIAVMMPFTDDPEVDPVFGAIRRGVESMGFRCTRVDQLKTPTDITEDIRNLICKSCAVVVDVSNMNPNVLYELGFAHGRGKKTILLSMNPLKQLPFDISHQRTFQYARSKLELEKLSKNISEALGDISTL